MVAIGWDRYNVIVKGLKAAKLTYLKAIFIVLGIWIYALVGCLPPFLGWGNYALGMKNQTKLYEYKKNISVTFSLASGLLSSGRDFKVLCFTMAISRSFDSIYGLTF